MSERVRLARKKETANEVPPIVQDVLSSSGQPLNADTRDFMEPRFGHDFSQVRVHTDERAVESAEAVNALAYTVGQDVVFGEGQYEPETGEGKRLLAHELTHVVQQGGLASGSNASLAIGPTDSSLEWKAGHVAESVGHGCSQSPIEPTGNQIVEPIVQREPQATDAVSSSDLGLAQEQSAHQRVVDHWYQRYLSNLETNARNAQEASMRFINFEEDGIQQLRTTGTLGTGVAYLFGVEGAVVALCIMVFTEVAAQNLSSKSAKIAATIAGLDAKLEIAKAEIETRYEGVNNRIESFFSGKSPDLTSYYNTIANLGVPAVVPGNIIFRDLLLQLAEQGGYNIDGSQWNVDNMSLFGKAPWYHSWDWASPGWINGRDIADELNALAEADPSTRKAVSINRP